MNKPAVLVIGAGMYVYGRGTTGVGTILPTLVQAQATGLVGELSVAATSRKSVSAVQDRLAEINRQLGTQAVIRGYPHRRETDSQAYRQALKDIQRPACAIVAVPDHLHAEIAAAVIQAGLHVLVVKPLTPTVTEAQQLIALARTHHVHAAVEFHKRCDEANLLLRQTIADGRLGELRHISIEYSQRREIQTTFRSWIRHTNIFQYLGVHYVDLIYFLTGAHPVRVLATGQPREAAGEGSWAYDAIQATIEWKQPKSRQGFTSTIMTNWIEPKASGAMSRQMLRVLGTRGRYDSDQTHRGVQLVTEDGVEDLNPYFSQLYRTEQGLPAIQGYGPRSIQQFLRDVHQLTEGISHVADLYHNRPSFHEALPSTAVVEAVNQSLANGEAWIDVETIQQVETANGRLSRRRTVSRAVAGATRASR